MLEINWLKKKMNGSQAKKLAQNMNLNEKIRKFAKNHRIQKNYTQKSKNLLKKCNLNYRKVKIYLRSLNTPNLKGEIVIFLIKFENFEILIRSELEFLIFKISMNFCKI